jgi:hypothetical protein
MSSSALLLGILLLCGVASIVSFNPVGPSFSKRHSDVLFSSRQIKMTMINDVEKKLRAAVVSALVASTAFGDISYAAAAPSVLEQSVRRLEAADTREDVIQGLADTFEASGGTKTLLVRTKYKYVSNYRLVDTIFALLRFR